LQVGGRTRRQETIEEILDIAAQIMAEQGVAGLSVGEMPGCRCATCKRPRVGPDALAADQDRSPAAMPVNSATDDRRFPARTMTVNTTNV
jgi:hypothetical protein